MGRKQHQKNSFDRRLVLESLESRQMMAANVMASLYNGILAIEGTSRNDTIIVQEINGRISVNGVAGSVAKSQVQAIAVNALGGNDRVEFRINSMPANNRTQTVVNGGDGNDYLIGSVGNDLLIGGSGNDTLIGGAANDVIFGGWGDDQAWGDSGDDRIYGENGNDQIVGGAGNDWLDGGYQDDRIWGGIGDDVLAGSIGNDMLSGDDGNDLLAGGDGVDAIYGGNGRNFIDGGAGYDYLYGGNDSDAVFDDYYGAYRDPNTLGNYYRDANYSIRFAGNLQIPLALDPLPRATGSTFATSALATSSAALGYANATSAFGPSVNNLLTQLYAQSNYNNVVWPTTNSGLGYLSVRPTSELVYAVLRNPISGFADKWGVLMYGGVTPPRYYTVVDDISRNYSSGATNVNLNGVDARYGINDGNLALLSRLSPQYFGYQNPNQASSIPLFNSWGWGQPVS